MPITEDDITRNTDDRQSKIQEFRVVAVLNQTVTLKFKNNSFRKHFLLPPQRGSQSRDAAGKLDNKIDKRGLLQFKAQKAGLIDKPTAKDYKKRYNVGTVNHYIVDLNTMNINTAMEKIAEACIQTVTNEGVETPVTADFGVCAVKVCKTSVGGGALTKTHKPDESTILLNAKKVGSVFTIEHFGP